MTPGHTNFWLSQTAYETPQEARPVRAFLFLTVYRCLPPRIPPDTVWHPTRTLTYDTPLTPETHG
ncbi:hypothetical protein FKZ69_00890 [Pseudomonas azotoformans]|nr:hypothetical protein FKZ69_00890 [Pseudomonas azotoformans]